MCECPRWSTPHHDGSANYVGDLRPKLGDSVAVFLRVPRASGVRRALLRAYVNGEQELTETVIDRQNEHEIWLRGHVRVLNPVVNYRWLLDGVAGGYQWLNGEGLHAHDVTDAADFRLAAHPAPPAWAQDAIVYQIFPDRFAKSVHRPTPPWAIRQAWGDPVIGDGPETPYQLYGGDLDGITSHLNHIAGTGANTVYLTPIFPAQSNHRYDASTFDYVDPLLGGDAALARLSDALHARGMRLLGDLTTNHCGDGHEWFRAAVTDANAPEAKYFLFNDHPHDYVCWFDIPSLPKFDHCNRDLRRRLYDGADSVVARWLGPHKLDGWRIDVANMTARMGATDLNHMVATTIRTTMAEAHPDSLLLAEHSHDASDDLLGDGWHGVMSYPGFARPVWQWLKARGEVPFEPGPFTALATFSGEATTETIRAFAAAQPWRATAHALTLLGSHDTVRIRTLLREPELITVAFGLLATMPGIPMLYAGDEIGQEGSNGENGRRPIPWDMPETWDMHRFAVNQSLFAARSDNVALRRGGMRWLAVEPDAITFLRESPEQTILVHAARAPHLPVQLPSWLLGPELHGLAGTGDLQPKASDLYELPCHGPKIHIWSCLPTAGQAGAGRSTT